MNFNEVIQTVNEWFVSSSVLCSMIFVQLIVTGTQILSRIILVEGTFIFALTSYRVLVAAICVAPLALYFERGQSKNFSCEVLTKIFLNGFVGMTMVMVLYYYGIRDTSATYALNFLNLIPICTFLTAILCRMENLNIHTWSGRAKCIGAILCVAGTLAARLYKGKEFNIAQYRIHHSVAAHKTQFLRGTLFLIGACFSYTAWFFIQVKLVEVFPLRYWGIMLQCVMAAIQSAVIGACVDSSKEAWRLGWNLQLITILYSGALSTAAVFCLQSWAINIKGPTYPSMFNPLALVFVAFAEAIIIGEPLTVGTLLGIVLIIVGLCSFLWGKRNEMPTLPQTNVEGQELPSMIGDHTVP